MRRIRFIVLTLASTLAVLGSLPFMGVIPDGPVVLLGLPGMFASMAVSGNVHAFSGVVALSFNLAFYTGIASLILWTIQRRGQSKGDAKDEA